MAMILIMHSRIRCLSVLLAMTLGGCGGSTTKSVGIESSVVESMPAVDSSTPSTDAGLASDRPRIVVTHSLLGATVSSLVGNSADVMVLIPNGTDPHEWSPSARDIAELTKSDLIVANGLNLEAGLGKAVEQAKADGVPVFYAAEHVTLRSASADHADDGADEDADEDADEHADEHKEDPADQHKDGDEHGGEPPSTTESHDHGSEDPHYWMDPLTVKQLVGPLTETLGTLGLDLVANAAALESSLDKTHAEVTSLLNDVPPAERRLVTGHESLGYFADRYGFELIGAVIPSFSSQAEASAGQLAELTAAVKRQGVPAVFTELGTPAATVESISADAKVRVVELGTHRLPEDGSYDTFMVGIATKVSEALR
jgi:zinc/manganese transport system substrate-binding protein